MDKRLEKKKQALLASLKLNKDKYGTGLTSYAGIGPLDRLKERRASGGRPDFRGRLY